MLEMSLGPLDVKERAELIRTTLWQYHKKLDERPMNNQMRDLLKKVSYPSPSPLLLPLLHFIFLLVL